MLAVTAESYLAMNLAALGERNSELAERLRGVTPHPELTLVDTAQGVPSGTLDDRQLCSRHRPLDEAARQVDAIDLVEHAVVVVLGFGLGYHVQRLAERSAKATLIIVFEPNLSLLRGVLERIDHSAWMRDALLVFVTDPADRGGLAGKLEGAESILAQGVHFFEHAASKPLLAESAGQFTSLFSECISAAKTTLTTTLMRSVDTVRNLILNVDHYAAGNGIADLQNLAIGCAGIVVSAGPSLHKNIHHLKNALVRERCVIIAVQTTLKPLLDAGITPHFVTALDYHEISKRFYEGLDAKVLRDVTLIAEPKANPVILDVYPGPVRCCANGFLDKLVGPMKREMGSLAPGATVAHLAMYFARFLGCNPIAMIGQDLGFTDGLYYAPGTAIHDVWSTELNAFNTIEMMEWQRIARHRLHLRKTVDVHGKSIYTDAQMHTYLQQFERDFAQCKREGLTIIDATEGGVAKQHAVAMPLADFVTQHIVDGKRLPALPTQLLRLDRHRLGEARKRLTTVRGEVRRLKEISHQTAATIREMLNDQRDQKQMARHFEAIQRNRKEVERRFEIFELLNQINQLGVFNRMKADRRLHIQRDLDALARQRGQLERDLANVNWTAEAAQELLEQLEQADRVIAGERVEARSNSRPISANHEEVGEKTAESRIAALIPIDPDRNALGIPRSLAEPFNGKPVLQATLERLGKSQQLQSIILIVPASHDIEAMIDRARIDLPVEIERTDGSPFGPERQAIAAARLWADSCWRGGIAGMSIYDEALCPDIMHQIMARRGLSAALIVAPDWPLVQVIGEMGCDAVIARHLEHPQQNNLVFTQAPPGLCGCVISASLMRELAQRNRLSTVGGLLVYQPHAPQGDPIARDANVQIDHAVRRGLVRATFDSPRNCQSLCRAMNEGSITQNSPAAEIVEALAACGFAPAHTLPRLITLELCSERTSHGLFRCHPRGPINRKPISVELAKRIFDQIGALDMHDIALALDGAGDPLLHPNFDQIINLAKEQGVRGVHVRTELLVDQATMDRLLQCEVDVVSVDLNADRAATYERMMGVDRFKDVLTKIEYLLDHRAKLTAHPGTAALALPWIVPHLQRCVATYEDIDTFYDRWQHALGAAVIEGPPPFEPADSLSPAVTPARVLQQEDQREMTILCDGSVPADRWDWPARQCAGNIGEQSLTEIWSNVLERRQRKWTADSKGER